MWDVTKAINHLNTHAQARSLSCCAQFVREAIEAGGVTLRHHHSAKNYGRSLLLVGFRRIVHTHANRHYHHRAGDVVVIQSILGHPHGHMAMFNGTNWVSDFTQHHGVYPGPAYRRSKPPYAVYRYGTE